MSMIKIRIFLLCLATFSLNLINPQFSVAETTTRNAIISEKNGAAVFIGYGGERSVELSWRPSKEFEDSVMLYQVKRSDGPMLESKTRASSFVDKNLQPNTKYTYYLTVFQSVTKQVTLKGQKIQKTTTKNLGTNEITVLTLPSMVVNLRYKIIKTTVPCTSSIELTWEAPEHFANQLKYSVTLNGNIMVYGLSNSTRTYTIANIVSVNTGNATNIYCNGRYETKLIAENDTGQAKINASLNNISFS